MRKETIIIAAGGTGGHVFPAVSVANELSSKFNIQFVSDRRGVKYLELYTNTAIVQNINTENRIKLYISVAINTLKSLFFLIKNRPLCVVGFGGYPSIPFVLAAQFLGIITVIHEQNAVIGLANKLLSKMADKTLLSFKEYGNPTRFEALYDNFKYTPSQTPDFKILVLGGSQGSQIVTENVSKGLCKISKEIRNNLFVYHQVRSEDMDFVQKRYEEYGISSIVQTFFCNMEEIYQNIDLMIGRSGASTVYEIIGFKIPALLIPFSGSINGDQTANANILAKAGVAEIFDEKTLQSFTDTVQDLYRHRSKLVKMSENYGSLYKSNVTKTIARTIEQLIITSLSENDYVL